MWRVKKNENDHILMGKNILNIVIVIKVLVGFDMNHVCWTENQNTMISDKSILTEEET